MPAFRRVETRARAHLVFPAQCARDGRRARIRHARSRDANHRTRARYVHFCRGAAIDRAVGGAGPRRPQAGPRGRRLTGISLGAQESPLPRRPPAHMARRSRPANSEHRPQRCMAPRQRRARDCQQRHAPLWVRAVGLDFGAKAFA